MLVLRSYLPFYDTRKEKMEKRWEGESFWLRFNKNSVYLTGLGKWLKASPTTRKRRKIIKTQGNIDA